MYKIIGGDGMDYGPVPAEMVRNWVVQGRANAQTRVLAEGATEWKPLGEVPELAQALPAAAAHAVPALPSLAPLPQSPQPRTHPLATTGLVLGLLSLTCGLCCYGLPFNILGIIFSLIALVQIGENPQIEKGRGLAVVGLVLSLLSILLAIGAALLLAANPADWLRRLQNL